jgi:hypothetical protein
MFIVRKVILISTFLLVACQSSIDITGNQHKSASEKWIALANYAESSLNRYGVTITAKLVSEQDYINQYDKLTDIQLSTKENFNDINLLSPDFLSKYTCNDNCERLNQYIPKPLKSGNTALIRYFSEYEFKLFKFYAELIQFNKTIDSIEANAPTLLDQYLHILVIEKRTFDSLTELISYLNEMLHKPLSDMQYFVDNSPYRQQQTELEKLFLSPNINWSASAPQSEWQKTASNEGQQAANHGWLKSGFSFPNVKKVEMPWVKYKEHQLTPIINAKFKQSGNVILSSLNNDAPFIETDTHSNVWIKAKELKYNVGDKVCTFNDNVFGIVEKIEGQEVQILTYGQAKQLDEFGVIKDVPIGALFFTNKEFTFEVTSQLQSFNLDDVAKCNIEML